MTRCGWWHGTLRHSNVSLPHGSYKVHCNTSRRLHSLIEYGEKILRTKDPKEKVAMTIDCHKKWYQQNLPIYIGKAWNSSPPLQPARDIKPQLLDPKNMPEMHEMNATIPIIMLHALAHIELGALDNYWDTLIRFNPEQHNLPREFYSDFLNVATDEAQHFELVADRLIELNSFYGALPATKALLNHASNTKDDLAARIAVIPLVQEARGLDSGERLVHKLQSGRDKTSAEIVEKIVEDEKRHVAYGIKWFRYLASAQNDDPVTYFHRLVKEYFPEGLPGPFNIKARLEAKMDREWFEPLESSRNKMQDKRQSVETIMLIGLEWPERTASAAGVRRTDFIQVFQKAGYQIICVAPSRRKDCTDDLEVKSISCHQIDPNTQSNEFKDLLLKTRPDVVIFDRFFTEEMYSWQVKEHIPDAIRILDLQDVNFLRKTREMLILKHKRTIPDIVNGMTLNVTGVKSLVLRELASIHRSCLTLYVSDTEYRLLTTRFQVPKVLLHKCDFFYPSDLMHTFQDISFKNRKHVVFIGSFQHSPNVDAIKYLRNVILPLTRTYEELHDVEFHIYGSYSEKQQKLINEIHSPDMGFVVKGFASDVHETLKKYRVNLAPLRFGAGIKGKVTDGWFVGTPCIGTQIAAEGMTLSSKENDYESWGGIVADTPELFVQNLAKLYTNESMWHKAQENGNQILKLKYDFNTNAESLLCKLQSLVSNKKQCHEENWMGNILWSEKFRASEYLSKYIKAKSGDKN